MANNSHLLLFFIICLSFFSCIPFVHSLSTVAISETDDHTLICALIKPPNQQAFVLNCTSFPQGIQVPVNPNTSFSGIVAGNGFLCGLISPSSSIMVCWRFSTNGTRMFYKRIYGGPAAIKDLDAGNSHICGLVNGANQLECWQWQRFPPSRDHNFSSVAVGENFVCGLSETGNISCVGNNTNVVGKEPRGNYSVVSAGFRHACAISENNSLDCWGEMVGEKPQGKFISLALGENRSCALWHNETVVCWGKNNFSLPERLQGTYFVTIEAKRSVFCGVVKANYSLFCWGNEILDSKLMVFDKVVPGPCSSKCSCVCCFFLYKYCKDRGCRRVHDSGRLDEPGTTPENVPSPRQQQAPPVLEKRLSHLVSLGNGVPMEEFPLQMLLEATNSFSEDHKIGTGSFGSVYRATLDDGREVAIKRAEISIILDPKVPPPTPFEIEAVAYVGYLAMDCVNLEGRDRPSMTEIVNSLKRALDACLTHPKLSPSSTESST
ncbi:serine/threonine-protein kinase-like protein ccr4 [Quercus suber]|uniref:non-specific serine/threonine protein kinase n=1 Tax=Quercus suber TaxID=58331 RepID=A0AAW0KJI4_QUESU